jgi:hypothetical protein
MLSVEYDRVDKMGTRNPRKEMENDPRKEIPYEKAPTFTRPGGPATMSINEHSVEGRRAAIVTRHS